MDKEEKSVRNIVKGIDKKTSELEPALKKLADSLNNISNSFNKFIDVNSQNQKQTVAQDTAMKAESLDKPSEDDSKSNSRDELLTKFAPKDDPILKVVKETNDNEVVLKEIKEAIQLNHRVEFKLFEKIKETLDRIAINSKSGGLGSMFDKFPSRGQPGAPGSRGADGRNKVQQRPSVDTNNRSKVQQKPSVDGKTKIKQDPRAIKQNAPSLDKKVESKAAQKAAKKGATSGVVKLAGRAAKFIPGVGIAAGLAMAGMDAFSGYDEAADNLDIQDREATSGEKWSSAAGSALSGLTFGLLDKKAASRGIASFFGAGPDKTEPNNLEGTTPVGPIPTTTTKPTGPIPTATTKPDKIANTSITAVNSVMGKEGKPSQIDDKIKELESQLKSNNDLLSQKLADPSVLNSKEINQTFNNSINKSVTEIKDKNEEIKKQIESLKVPSRPANISSPPPSTVPSTTVDNISRENQSMLSQPPSTQPIIISNNNATSSSTQTIAPTRTLARPTNNSFERKQNEVSSY